MRVPVFLAVAALIAPAAASADSADWKTTQDMVQDCRSGSAQTQKACDFGIYLAAVMVEPEEGKKLCLPKIDDKLPGDQLQATVRAQVTEPILHWAEGQPEVMSKPTSTVVTPAVRALWSC